jgi:hypothetical protein
MKTVKQASSAAAAHVHAGWAGAKARLIGSRDYTPDDGTGADSEQQGTRQAGAKSFAEVVVESGRWVSRPSILHPPPSSTCIEHHRHDLLFALLDSVAPGPFVCMFVHLLSQQRASPACLSTSSVWQSASPEVSQSTAFTFGGNLSVSLDCP